MLVMCWKLNNKQTNNQMNRKKKTINMQNCLDVIVLGFKWM